MKFVNLTGHEVFETKSGTLLPKGEQVARIRSNTNYVDSIGGAPVFVTEIVSVRGLPEPQEGVVYVVSALVLSGIPDSRTDVVSPGNVIRKNGEVVGCVGFRRKV